MGVMNARNPDLVRRALELGIRHLDTAFVYGDGQNESMVGKVVADMKLRDKVVIATKEMVSFQRRGLSGAKAADALIKMVEASLKRLQSDYVDIVYIHDVTTPEDAVHPGFLEGMRKLKEQGKIRFAGLFDAHEHGGLHRRRGPRTDPPTSSSPRSISRFRTTRPCSTH